jgi:hypothetical protein
MRETKISDAAKRALLAIPPSDATVRWEAERVKERIGGDMILSDEWLVRFPDEIADKLDAARLPGENDSDLILRLKAEGALAI